MRLNLAAWVALVLIGGVLVGARPTTGQEKADAKGGVDAKAAFKRIKAMVGTWKGQTSGEHQEEHKGESTVTYKLTGGGRAARRDPASRRGTRDGFCVPPRR